MVLLEYVYARVHLNIFERTNYDFVKNTKAKRYWTITKRENNYFYCIHHLFSSYLVFWKKYFFNVSWYKLNAFKLENREYVREGRKLNNSLNEHNISYTVLVLHKYSMCVSRLELWTPTMISSPHCNCRHVNTHCVYIILSWLMQLSEMTGQ